MIAFQTSSPYLVGRIDQAPDQPMVVITAPTGWRKTTLDVGWAGQAGYQ